LFSTLLGQTSSRLGAFFFGATDDIGQLVRKRLAERASGLNCAGAFCPGFGSVASMSDPGIINRINQADPDLLVVAVGAHKGILWLSRNERLLSAPIVCNLGATINFLAGRVTRAPLFFRRHGLEWLWRIKEEPTLWTRYALDLATLISVLIGQVLPCLAWRTLHKPSVAELSAAHLQHDRRETAEILAFSGVWTKQNLAPVRAALTAATRNASNLVIDLDRVTFADAAFLGQMLLAYGYQRRMQRGFSLHASRKPLRRMLRLHGCGYLLDPGEKNSEPASAAQPLPADNWRTRETWIASDGVSRIASHRH
jgi:N-acetylglucosaminyldiphosphoundecaprenol N-acetyl-beta-D-mannosaminyltransferase